MQSVSATRCWQENERLKAENAELRSLLRSAMEAHKEEMRKIREEHEEGVKWLKHLFVKEAKQARDTLQFKYFENVKIWSEALELQKDETFRLKKEVDDLKNQLNQLKEQQQQGKKGKGNRRVKDSILGYNQCQTEGIFAAYPVESLGIPPPLQ